MTRVPEARNGRFRVGFGLERLGLAALNVPRWALAAVVLLSLAMMFAAAQLTFSSEIREVFRSDQPEFELLDRTTAQYPGNERVIFVLVQGEIGFAQKSLEPLQQLHNSLNWLDGVQKVISVFSVLRRSPDGGTEPLIGPDLENLPPPERLKREVMADPLAKDTLVAKGGDGLLFLVTLNDKDWSLEEVQSTLDRLRKAAAGALKGSSLTFELAGLPMIRSEIIGALQHDQAVFKVLGLLLGSLIAWLFFRDLRYVAVTVAPAAVAVVWLLGLQAVLGLEITVLNNVVPVLVMVIAFADSLHLVFAIRRKLNSGMQRHAAVAQAVREVGPACALTSITTALCLSTLSFLPQSFLSGFGTLAALGTALAFVATMLTLPPLAMVVLRREAVHHQPAQIFAAKIETLSAAVSGISLKHPAMMILSAGALLVLTGLGYFMTEPRYLYRDHLPVNSPVEAVTRIIDQKFSGVAEVRVFLQWPEGQDLLAPPVREATRKIHAWLAEQAEVGSVRSLFSIEQVMEDAARAPETENSGHLFASITPQKFALQYARELGVASSDHFSTLLVAQTLDLAASETLPFLKRLRAQLDRLEAGHDGLKADYTGIAPVAASMSNQMIHQLNRSLLLAIVLVVVLIGVTLGSFRAALVSLMPNLLPITVAGSFLLVSGHGLQFTSVVAFTVGFGIAVDNIIHLLNRYRIECDAAGESEEALLATMTKTGPVLTTGALVLIAGLGATIASSMPMVALFGKISVLLLSTALLASLVLFPAQMFLLSGKSVHRK